MTITARTGDALAKPRRKYLAPPRTRTTRVIAFVSPKECMERRVHERDRFQERVYRMDPRTHAIDVVFGMIVPRPARKPGKATQKGRPASQKGLKKTDQQQSHFKPAAMQPLRRNA